MTWWFLYRVAFRRQTILRLREKSKVAGISASQFAFLAPIFLLELWVAGILLVTTRRGSSNRILVFNLDALGHYLMEFSELLQQVRQTKVGCNIKIIYLDRGKSSRANSYLITIFERLAAGRGISFLPLRLLFWVPAAALAELLEATPYRPIRPMHPTYSSYGGLEAEEVLRVIEPTEKERFELYMDSRLPSWRVGYCVLGVRDSAYYRDFNSHRNSPLSIYVPGVNFLLDEGIAVVRMGRKVSGAFPIQHDAFLDYAFLGDSDDFLDVMLWTHCSFAIGDSTGLTDAVALLGGKTLCATYPMDPRSFLSSPNYFFALQELVHEKTGNTLRLREVIDLMNQGWNIGAVEELRERGYVNVMPSPSEVEKSIKWFVNELNKETQLSTLINQQQKMMEVLAKFDEDAWPHYRKDAMYSHSWLDLVSKVYPGSLSRIL